MNINNKVIWQQAAGDTDRDYSDLCLKWDVILNGPGYAGKWPECKLPLKKNHWSARKISDLRRFCEDVKEGDLIVLRLGTTDILGVGEVVGQYQWLEEFGDVDGWDLQHVRRVRWFWKGLNKPKKFPAYSLKLGDTTQKLDSKDVSEWIKSLDIPKETFGRNIVELPSCKHKSPITYEEISEYLFDQGVASNSIEHLLREIDELIRIAKWYKKFQNPSERETIAYLVVPLLRALGWTPQKMAIEWSNVDLALFDRLPRSDGSLSVVVEAKKKDKSCLTAQSQAQSYAQGKQGCRRLVVTDGLRYGIYIRNEGVFSLYAYMNLTNLKDEYPIYGCYGVKEALRAMTPEWGGSNIQNSTPSTLLPDQL